MGGQAGMTDAFLAAMAGMLGMVAALYVVAAVLRLHGEETSQRAEPVLANAVGRLRWAGGHLVVAFGGAVADHAARRARPGLGYGDEIGARARGAPRPGAGGLDARRAGGAPLRPGPQAAPAAWGVVAACLLIGLDGPALNVPQAVMDLSPFGHLPKLPGTEMQWAPVLLLTALARP